ncbi:aminotransferase [Exophiala viscosa]|uniref:Aminotransferase n=1 Tax=Exophiala viscosa TaxID=2486360 RepID=A0AAN6IBY3_9EURO|nr:aminotransferase [Exophiala viscosa]KAI1623345.1 aminotransferase [Exophiala viscosa]
MATMQKVFAAYEARKAMHRISTNPYAQGIAWVAGALVPLAEARIPLQDQGFMHGDLTYDVPSIWDGRFFRLEDHLNRLQASCEKMRLMFPISKEQIKDTLIDMARKSGIRDAFIQIIVTRGLKGVRGSRPEDICKNNLYMWIEPYIWVQEPKVQLAGSGSAVITRTVRRIPPGSFDPTIKNLQWGDLTRGMFEAMDRGAMYPFLTDGDANLTEGSGFNVLFVKDGTIYTPLRGCLEGVTRKSVFDVAKTHGIEVRVEFVPTQLAYTCDECFMSTTAGGIMPITSLDGVPIKDGQIGPISKTIWDGYWAMHYDPNFSFAIDDDSENVKGANRVGKVTEEELFVMRSLTDMKSFM